MAIFLHCNVQQVTLLRDSARPPAPNHLGTRPQLAQGQSVPQSSARVTGTVQINGLRRFCLKKMLLLPGCQSPPWGFPGSSLVVPLPYLQVSVIFNQKKNLIYTLEMNFSSLYKCLLISFYSFKLDDF